MNNAGGIDSFADVGTKSAKRTKPHFIIGKNASSGISVIADKRQLNYFVSRLGVDTHPDQLKNFIAEKIGDGVQRACEKLKTRYEFYASFRVDFILTRMDYQSLRRNSRMVMSGQREVWFDDFGYQNE